MLIDEPMSDELRKLIEHSPFTSIYDAESFLDWYRTTVSKTQHDENLRDLATQICIQADKDEHFNY